MPDMLQICNILCNTYNIQSLSTTKSVIPVFTPLKLQDKLILRSPPSKKCNRKTVFIHNKVSYLPKVFKLQVLWSLVFCVKDLCDALCETQC